MLLNSIELSTHNRITHTNANYCLYWWCVQSNGSQNRKYNLNGPEPTNQHFFRWEDVRSTRKMFSVITSQQCSENVAHSIPDNNDSEPVCCQKSKQKITLLQVCRTWISIVYWCFSYSRWFPTCSSNLFTCFPLQNWDFYEFLLRRHVFLLRML